MDTNTSLSIPTLDSSLVEASVRSSNNEGSCQSYWERVPAEIMETIFLMCRPLDRNRTPYKAHAPYLLTYVCWSWYKTVMELPKMWSTVVLTIANGFDTIPTSRLEAGARHLAMSIARSKAAPRGLYIRAEFIAFPASFKLVQCVEWQQLVLIYPHTVGASFGLLRDIPFFPPQERITMPNLTVLEIHSQSTISRSDQAVLSSIIDSARTLKRHVSPKNGIMSISGQLNLTNMSNLEELTLQRLIPIHTYPFILHSAPSLRKLSLAVWVPSGDETVYEGMKLLYTSNQPIVHPRLEYLALAHFKCDLSTIFEGVTLPLLRFLSLDFRGRASMEHALWPHKIFVAFLQRSGCKLKSFQYHDQPIITSCLLELLRLPHLADSLEYLGIQHYLEEELVVDDSLLEELTLPPVALQREVAPTLAPDSEVVDSNRSSPPILCPNIERLILFVPFERFTLSKLITMFDSRLPSSANPVLPHKPLRQVEMDLCEEIDAEFNPLREKGLVLTLFEPTSLDCIPLDAEQQKMWKRHLSEGLDDEIYDPVTMTWRTSDITLEMS